MVADHAVQRLPYMRLIDFLHSNDANLAHRDAMKSHFDDSWNIALVSQKSKVVAFSRNLPHHARLAGRHLPDDRGNDRLRSVCDALHFELGAQQVQGDIVVGLTLPSP